MQSNTLHSSAAPATGSNIWLKRGVWAYFLLLIFEGALRKWFLPGLNQPLLVVRDPIALWLIYSVWRRGAMPKSFLLMAMTWIGVVSIFTSLFLGHGNLAVAIFGARILLIHFPMIFVIGRILDRDDVIKMGRALLWITIPMAVLIGLQFYSPQNAFVNRGVGGDTAGAGFSGAMGYFRPPATFSFTNGTHLFFGMAACFIFYFWMNPKGTSKIALYGATVALVAAIPLSISRSLTFFTAISFMFLMVSVVRKPANLMKIVFAAVGFVLVVALLTKIPFFQTATEAFFSRFSAASDSEGGLEGTIGERFLGGMSKALMNSNQQPFFGYGIGMGTNVGSMVLTGGRKFLISEEEWGRVIGELGPILGMAVILIRLALCAQLFTRGYRRMVAGDLLPWMLLGYALLAIPQGQWAQPTSLGFSVVIGGLMLAAMRGPLPEELRPAVQKPPGQRPPHLAGANLRTIK